MIAKKLNTITVAVQSHEKEISEIRDALSSLEYDENTLNRAVLLARKFTQGSVETARREIEERKEKLLKKAGELAVKNTVKVKTETIERTVEVYRGGGLKIGDRVRLTRDALDMVRGRRKKPLITSETATIVLRGLHVEENSARNLIAEVKYWVCFDKGPTCYPLFVDEVEKIQPKKKHVQKTAKAEPKPAPAPLTLVPNAGEKVTYSKGQRIFVTGNSIFEIMGYDEVTGTIFNVNPNGKSLSIRCEETGAIELVEIGDGEIEVLS